MELFKLSTLAQMPGRQVQRINATISEDCKEQEALSIEANQRLRTNQAAQRQFEYLCKAYST